MAQAETELLGDLTGEFRIKALRQARISAWALIGVFLIVVLWASFATMNETVRGSGTIVPSSRMQTIQSLEGGILEVLHVGEGDVVKEGDLLAKISDTQARSEYLEMKSEYDALDVEVQRLEAEVLGRTNVAFTSDRNQDKADLEMDLFQARQNTLQRTVEAKQKQVDAIQEKIDLMTPLTESGAVSKAELIDLRERQAGIIGDLEKVKNDFTQESYRNLVEKRARMDSLRQGMLQSEDRLERTEVRARVSGRINNINITTSGGVIRPGETIMEVSPEDDQLVIETLIAPRDVALVAPGMDASVKITAYDFSIYGDIPGTVVNISPDTVESPDPQDKTPYYKVLVKTEKSYLERAGQQYPLRSGMLAEVDILGEKRTILNYLIRPIIKARLQ
ncbi:HlyD family efflux transporter periplasmic adaptor subunit [Pseudosulfitobacter pseudonitzschiae]|uniref:HlyD family efflux transporter periplasmic adaptor subunit n=1 Tax=Pseudosulfitobacter pseudonitzschiae TaxID=1402135 RepID=UPI003B8016A1